MFQIEHTYTRLHYMFFSRFRKKRMEKFLALIAPSVNDRVLDIGGSEHTWIIDAGGTGSFPVTLVNLSFKRQCKDERFTQLVADATRLQIPDGSFEVVYSNSVIEHVGDFEKQKAFADEARRVGRRLWIQTPARCFPVEPHLMAPFFHFLPRSLQLRLYRLTPRGMISPAEAKACVGEVRLLTFSEFKQLFPDCQILKEKLLGITKSYIAVRA